MGRGAEVGEVEGGEEEDVAGEDSRDNLDVF